MSEVNGMVALPWMTQKPVICWYGDLENSRCISALLTTFSLIRPCT